MGGATCFTSTRAAYEALDEETQARLEGLECLCSLAHHDAKIHSYTPSYPLLSEKARLANPAQRVPLVLSHPLTGRKALYGLNSGTFAVFPKGTPVSQEQLDTYDLTGKEDPTVEKEWRASLLPFATQDRFTVVWRWGVGDLLLAR